MDINATTEGMDNVHDRSLRASLGGDDRQDDGAPAVDVLFPRVIADARLVGVPQAGRTDDVPGCDPYKLRTSSTRRPSLSLYSIPCGLASHFIRRGYSPLACPIMETIFSNLERHATPKDHPMAIS